MLRILIFKKMKKKEKIFISLVINHFYSVLILHLLDVTKIIETKSYICNIISDSFYKKVFSSFAFIEHIKLYSLISA